MNFTLDTRKDFQFVETENDTLIFQFDKFIMRPHSNNVDKSTQMKRLVTENAYHTLVTAVMQNQFSDLTWNIMMIGITAGNLHNLVIMRFNRGTTELTLEKMKECEEWKRKMQMLYREYTNPFNSIANDYILDSFSQPYSTVVKQDAVWAMLECTRIVDERNTSKTMMSTWFNFVFRKMKKGPDDRYYEETNFGTVDLLEKYCGHRFTTADLPPQMAFIPNITLIEPR